MAAEGAAHVVRACSSCGAAVELAAAAVSARCGYCDSPLVDAERAALRVDRVAPFRIARGVAEEKLRLALAARRWAPAAIRRGLVRRERLRALLVPFWVFEGTARSRYRAAVGIHWERKKLERDNGGWKTRTVRETEWFELQGSSARALEGHLVSASTGLPEADANRLEPFDLGRARPYDPRLLAAVEAELPTVSHAQAEATAREEVARLEREWIARSLLPGDEGRVEEIDSDIVLAAPEVVLLPVWVSAYRHGERVYRQLVNGQTGATHVEAPVSAARVALAVAAAVAAATVLLAIFAWAAA